MTPNEQENLVLDNWKLVPHIAREFTKNPDLLEELIGEGNIGLVNASRSYDESKGSFLSIARKSITNQILKYLNKEPKNQISFDSIINSEGLTLSETLADTNAPTAEQAMIKKELIKAMNQGISRLHTREAWLIRRHYGLDGFDPMTMQELGDYIGSSKQYVYQLIQESLVFIRDQIKKA
jgi:RNA polymerase sporulation-specific sigma factor